MNSDLTLAVGLLGLVLLAIFQGLDLRLSVIEQGSLVAITAPFIILGLLLLWQWKSQSGRARRSIREKVSEIPVGLKLPGTGVLMGKECDLGLPIYLPNTVRLRHIHILGATGSGKTESVILNFLRQDIAAGHGAVIMDGKGDNSFLEFLKREVGPNRLEIFDLGDPRSGNYNPLSDGSPAESAQRLFSSMQWSEEYYKSKALTALQRMFTKFAVDGKNPSLPDLARILESAKSFGDGTTVAEKYTLQSAKSDYDELSGLRDQVNLLCSGHLNILLSGIDPVW